VVPRRRTEFRATPRQSTAKVVVSSEVLEAFMERVEQAFAEADDGREDSAERQQALDDCVSSLPERSRKMLSLRYEARTPVEEVAQAMGQTFESVTKALYRMRRALLECVERKLSHE